MRWICCVLVLCVTVTAMAADWYCAGFDYPIQTSPKDVVTGYFGDVVDFNDHDVLAKYFCYSGWYATNGTSKIWPNQPYGFKVHHLGTSDDYVVYIGTEEKDDASNPGEPDSVRLSVVMILDGVWPPTLVWQGDATNDESEFSCDPFIRQWHFSPDIEGWDAEDIICVRVDQACA